MAVPLNDKSFIDALNRLDNYAKDLKPTFEQVATILEKDIKKNFQVEGKYSSKDSFEGGGSKWKPLDAKYAIAKRKRWGVQKINTASGDLKGTLGHETTAKKLTIGFGTKYAPYVQAVRPILNASKEAIEKAKAVIIKNAKKAMQGK